MKKALIFFVVVVIFISGVYFYAIYGEFQKPRPNNKSAVIYDQAIKAVYGMPIKVARVIDGDTVELINGERLRYIGVDTPEEVDPRKPVQCFAAEAAEKNKELVEGKTIIFKKDISTRDRYGRWLGFVYLEDGTFVNDELVRQGYAFSYPYPPDISLVSLFNKDETAARDKKLGLWSACEVFKEKSGREQTNTIE